MKYQGFIEKEFGGKKRGFQFGMGAFFIMSDEWGEEIGIIEDKVSKIAQKKDPTSRDLMEMLKYNRMLIYAGMKNYDLINENPIDYNWYEYNVWADECSAEDWRELTDFSAKTKEIDTGEKKAEQTTQKALQT